MRIRFSYRNQGGPSRGGTPTMVHDKVLPRGQRAGFEALNDAAAMRPTITDAGSLVAANDNKPEIPKSVLWHGIELKYKDGSK